MSERPSSPFPPLRSRGESERGDLSPILHLTPSDLPPRVRQYVDNLTAQCREFLKSQGVRSIEEFELQVKTKKAKGELTTLQANTLLQPLKDILEKLGDIRKTGKLPAGAHAEILGAKLREARDLLGEANVFGPEQITKAWDIDLDPDDIPEMPYSTEDLEKAKELGEILILRVGKDREGKPLTIKTLKEMTDPILTETNGGKTIYDAEGDDEEDVGNVMYEFEDYFTEPILPRWVLISPKILPGSDEKNYLEQTIFLRDYLRKHNLLTSEEDEELDEKTIANLREYIKRNSSDLFVHQKLLKLKINQNHRRTAGEAVYDIILRTLVTGEYPSELGSEDWTRSDENRLIIAVGYTNSKYADGIEGTHFGYYRDSPNLGCSSVR